MINFNIVYAAFDSDVTAVSEALTSAESSTVLNSGGSFRSLVVVLLACILFVLLANSAILLTRKG